jgi:hypothetical protein
VNTQDTRNRFIDYFRERGHEHVSSSSLIPPRPDDPVLFVTSGMHPLIPYLRGEPHPQGTRLVNSQRCLRTTDLVLTDIVVGDGGVVVGGDRGWGTKKRIMGWSRVPAFPSVPSSADIRVSGRPPVAGAPLRHKHENRLRRGGWRASVRRGDRRC